MTPDERERVYPRLMKVGECLVWTGSASRGYGYVALKQDGRWRGRGVHRLVYEDQVGPIPEGLTLDHLCRNKLCALPAHLEPVTDRVNILRGFGPTALNARKTHCKRGHLLAGHNLLNQQRGRPPGRVCRPCSYLNEKRRNSRKR